MKGFFIACMLVGLVGASSLGYSELSKALAATDPTSPDPVLVGAGDIASCAEQGDELTAKMLDGIPGTVFTTGDNAYNSGTAAEYRDCYEPTWGRHKARTRPAPGNHDYKTSSGAPYYDYFDQNAGLTGKGYYSYELGAWHVISLNSNAASNPGSEQYEWLRADLSANQSGCTVAYWHEAVFSSGEHGNSTKMAEVWKLLDEAGVDVALVGHDHDYERFAPQDYTGKADPNGMRQFVVGTGGRHLRPFATIQSNSEARNSTTLGLLKMTLHPDSYDFEFVPQPDRTFRDSGTIKCDDPTTSSPPPPPNTAPRVTNLSPAPGSSTRDRTPTISARLRDDETDLAKKNVKLYVDGRKISDFAYDRAADKLTYTSTPLSRKRHTVKVVAKDAQGLTESKSWNFKVTR